MLILLSTGLLASVATASETTREKPPGPGGPPPRCCSVGASLLMLANLAQDSPSFVQLVFGTYLTPNDVLSVEGMTFQHKSPLGIPYGPSFNDDDEHYPGRIRELAVGVTYQRFLWRGAFAAVHASPFLRIFQDADGERIQSGFMLFTSLRAGYHLRLFDNRAFIEPTLAVNYWPITTHVPAPFAAIEDRWPRYFLLDPNLVVGIKF